MVRKPVVSGQFYEGDAELLEKQIKGCFTNSPGPGALPKGSSDRIIRGAIVPHAGFVFSGYAAAHVYKAIAESKRPETFIVIGPNHSGMGYNSVCLDDFETPFGMVRVDKKLGDSILKNTELVDEGDAHLHEHSVEVQLPFLQFIYKYDDKLRFVPVVVSDIDYVELGNGIKKAIAAYGKNVCVLASSDFTHFGFNYGYRPFSTRIRENLMELDSVAFRYIEKKDSKSFMEYINRTGATICGKYPIAVLLESIDINRVTKLCHYSSGDIVGDFNNAVDYISAIIE